MSSFINRISMYNPYCFRWLTLFVSWFFAWQTVNAQAPQSIPYQAVARNSAGNLLQNQAIALRFTIRDGSANGTVEYQETHHVTTNTLGLFTLNIGQGTAASGTFAGINWSSGLKFTQVELDATANGSYTDMGTTQMLSVPYALYAATSGSTATETDPQVSAVVTNRIPKWDGTTLLDGLLYDDGTNIGVGTGNPATRLHILGNSSSERLLRLTGSRPVGTWLDMENTSTGGALHSFVSTGSGNTEGAGKLLFRNSSSTLMTLDGTGNVGIGTTAPENTLHVVSSGAFPVKIESASQDGVGLKFYSSAMGQDFELKKMGYSGANGGNIHLNNNGSTALAVNLLNNIGIGTNSPLSRLHVSGGSSGSLQDRVLRATTASANGTWFDLENSSAGGTLYSVVSSGEDNSEGAGKLLFRNSNSTLMTLDGTGNVGIGTTSPVQKLDVNGTTKTTGFQMTGGAANGYILQSDASGNASWVEPSGISETDPQVSSTTTSRIPRWTGTTLSDGSIFDNGAKVGIGTTTPANTLHVVSSDAFPVKIESSSEDGFGLKWYSSFSDEDFELKKLGYFGANPGNIHLNNNGSTALAVSPSNYVGIGTTSPSTRLHVNGGNDTERILRLAGSKSSGSWFDLENSSAGGTMYSLVSTGSGNSEGAGKLLFRNSSSNLMTLNGAGNLGIGTTSPTQKLDVSGTTKTTNFQMTTGAANGYLLQSDALGNASWVNASSIETDPQVSSGTTGRVPRWTGTTLSDGSIFDNDAKVGIGTTTPANTLHVVSSDAFPVKIESSSEDGFGLKWYSSFSDEDFELKKLGYFGANPGNIHLNNNGSTALAVSTLNYVGIGTTSPSTRLHIDGGNNTERVLRVAGSRSAGSWFDLENSSAGGTMYSLVSTGSGNSEGAGKLLFRNSSSSLMTLNGAGNFGIGTYSPVNKLDVEGGIAVGSTYSGTSNAPANGAIIQGDLGVGTANPGYKFHVTSADSYPVVMGLQSTSSLGTWLRLINSSSGGGNWNLISTGEYDDIGPGNLIFNNSDGVFSENGAQVTFTSTGNVGIGTTSPGQKLDVTGTTKTTNFQMTDGAVSGFVLQTDADGNAAWVNPATLSVTETDPQVNSSTTGRVPRWTGTALSDGTIFDNGTNVGIGTSSPQAKLDVNGSAIIDRSGTNTGDLTNGTLRFGGSTSGEAIASCRTSAGNQYGLDFYTNDRIQMSIDVQGNVGIGTTVATQAQLVIEGSESTNIGGFGYLNDNGNTGTSSGTHNYSIYASDRIAATEFNAHSDARIKHIHGRSDNAADLATLMQLKITDYTLIDTVAKGAKPYKKVIAQEVEQVYPQAVSTITGVTVPDIYQLSTIENGLVALPHTDLKVGDRVKLILGEKQEMTTVTAISEKGFQTNLTTGNGPVFVFGREVSDFRTVDYEALSMLNVSATQELVRQLEALKQQNAALQNRVNDLQNLEKRMAAIEAMLNASPVGASATNLSGK